MSGSEKTLDVIKYCLSLNLFFICLFVCSFVINTVHNIFSTNYFAIILLQFILSLCMTILFVLVTTTDYLIKNFSYNMHIHKNWVNMFCLVTIVYFCFLLAGMGFLPSIKASKLVYIVFDSVVLGSCIIWFIIVLRYFTDNPCIDKSSGTNKPHE